MDKTDFANNDDLIVLLDNLQRIFREFKNHEEIENEFIMGPINSKLKVSAIEYFCKAKFTKDNSYKAIYYLYIIFIGDGNSQLSCL